MANLASTAASQKPKSQKGLSLILILAAVGFIAGLLAFAYMGSFIRLIGDDYCYAGVLQTYGFFDAQAQSYLNKMPYHGDRFSLTLISTLISLLRPEVNGVIPGLTILAFVGSLVYFFASLSARFSLRLPKGSGFFLGLVAAYFTLLMTPTVKQSLYFRSAMLPSFAQIIGTLFLAGFILRPRPLRWVELLPALLFSVLNGGLSENGAAFQGMATGIIFLVGLIGWLFNKANRPAQMSLSAAAILGTIVAGVVMWLSPSIAEARGEMSISIITAFGMSLRHAWAFFSGVFRTQYNAVGIVFLATLSLFVMSLRETTAHEKLADARPGHLLVALLLSQVVAFALIFSLMLPSAVTRSAYPDPRHLIGGVLVVILDILFSAFLLGRLVLALWQKKGNALGWKVLEWGAATLLVAVALAYPVRYIPTITRDRQLFSYWSQQWTQRHAEIVAAADAGEVEIHVLQLDHIIEDVGELGPDPATNWYNQCAINYYGVTIYADQPGWEEGFNQFQSQQ